MRREEQIEEATDIVVKAGALSRGEDHPEIVWDNFGDHEEAYKIGNARFTAGELQTHSESRRELTDAIKAAIEEAGMDGCPICAKMLKDLSDRKLQTETLPTYGCPNLSTLVAKSGGCDAHTRTRLAGVRVRCPRKRVRPTLTPSKLMANRKATERDAGAA